MGFEGYSFNEIKELLENRKAEFSYGEFIKTHTVKKIEYIRKYVEHWLYVVSHVSKYIFFIDAMSNAGIYESGDLSTSIEVLNTFVKFSLYHPDINFFLISNDYDAQKVSTMQEIFNIYIDKFKEENISNVHLKVYCKEACDFITTIKSEYHFQFVYGTNKSVLLYVDPYNLIKYNQAVAIKDFIKSIYCELIINFFCNDYTRNVNNPKCTKYREEIGELIHNFCCFDENDSYVRAEQLRDCLANKLIDGTHMKFRYYVKMKNEMNVTLYYLIYLTPNIEGLRKVKEATWKALGPTNEYCVSQKESDANELNLFNRTPEEEAFVAELEKVSPAILSEIGKELSFENIEVICLQNTFMKKGHIIRNVIRPLIDAKKIRKVGYVKAANYTEDKYIVLQKDN
ncbi:MAG: three-Cys-motif partner protein TcmP [Acholeplasmataceae bacterium]|jgi:three-Cys-motif partner protein